MTTDPDAFLTSEAALVAAAVGLGAESIAGVSPAETALECGVSLTSSQLAAVRERANAGDDPLGTAFCRLRSAEDRRPVGATYTPSAIVEAMCEWAATGRPARVIDPGAGSGRFSVATGKVFSDAQVIAVEPDPLAALLCRANLAMAGLAGRSTVVVGDYRDVVIDHIDGPTLFIGNPPYVRHHQIDAVWKDWLHTSASERGFTASKLAGLHVHFFLATALRAQTGDYGAFITSSEWLDVNYGSLVRELLLNDLGGTSVHLLEPTVLPFTDAATTAAISTFTVGSQPTSLRLRRVQKVVDVQPLKGGKAVSRERLSEAKRWTPLFYARQKLPDDQIELGELCRVHRGTVTGANAVWIADETTQLDASLLRASVTRAKELFSAGTDLDRSDGLRRVIDLPRDLNEIDDQHRPEVNRFLDWAKAQGAHKGYVARNRAAWWAVDLRAPAPILATYMARRPPAFVRNNADARHINIAHGLYPREEMTGQQLNALAASLRATVTLRSGRTYAGGLTKFEPREMERLSVPTLEALSTYEPPATPAMV